MSMAITPGILLEMMMVGVVIVVRNLVGVAAVATTGMV